MDYVAQRERIDLIPPINLVNLPQITEIMYIDKVIQNKITILNNNCHRT